MSWLATHGKGVTKHIGNHSRTAKNLALKNPRFAARAAGKSTHSMFADSRPKKLIQIVLEKYDHAVVQKGGRIVVEKQFNRVIGKAGEKIIRVVIDPRTGRIITAFPVLTFIAAGAAGATSLAPGQHFPGAFLGATYDERLVQTIQGVEKLAQDWERSKPKPRVDVWAVLLDLLIFDSTPANHEDEILYVRVTDYVGKQADRMLVDLAAEIGHPLPAGTKAAMRAQFIKAVSGFESGSDDW